MTQRSNKVRVLILGGIICPTGIEIGPKDAVLDCKTGVIEFFGCLDVQKFYKAFAGQPVTLVDAVNKKIRWTGFLALKEQSGFYYIDKLSRH